ncbi:MAG: SUMF1/EgtB/PvdO family nonheme iron enzyme [Saprospiraceae bacterium]|nr:SUMF1/EgtB/PvdO family nonheme iron enzyme [Saprospiraceae bacterium]
MQHLKTIQTDLKNRIPQEGITAVIKALKELLPEEAPKCNTLLQLEAAYNDVKLKGIEGILSDEALMLANNQIRKRLIELIDSLEEDDFNVNLKRSRLRPDNKIKQGHVLYRIPHQMQLQKEVKCIVRIALDKIALIEDLDLDAHTQVRSEVRVSDYMKVLLIDPAASPAFAIRSTSEPVQFIDEDAATEWKFYVTPLLPGRHILELKVVVMEIINGVERVREKSLEESVVIVTEAVEEMDDAPLQSANMDFVTSDPAYALEKNQSGYRLPKALRTGALVLAALMVVSTATFAFIPPVDQRWLMTRYWYDTPEAYEQFINENPNSKRVDDASFRKAKLRQSPQELQQFIETFEKSEYKEQAEIELQKLEEKAWQEVQSVTEPAALQQFLEVFPKGKRADDATVQLQQLEEKTWQRIKTTTNRDSLQQFVKTFPNGRYTPEVQKVLQQTQTLPSRQGGQQTLSADMVKKLQNIQPTTPAILQTKEKSATTDTTVQKATEPAKTETLPSGAKEKEEPVKTEPAVTPPSGAGGQETTTDNEPFDALKPKMVLVKGGTFQMGSNEYAYEKPIHTVTVSDFYISKYEVTFDEYDAFCDATKRQKPADEGWGHGKRPVINVSWDDATAYCKWLSEKTGQNYRLPTEAEWEYAARGGAKSGGFEYSGSKNLDEVAWYGSNSGSKTHPVGQKKANELGLYDMSGNVYEWVQDCWNENYKGAPTNGSAWLKGDCSVRVIRGGSWNINFGSYCRVASRNWYNLSSNNYVGFRLVRD